MPFARRNCVFKVIAPRIRSDLKDIRREKAFNYFYDEDDQRRFCRVVGWLNLITGYIH